jgi:hypothetical protein
MDLRNMDRLNVGNGSLAEIGFQAEADFHRVRRSKARVSAGLR